jgi:hypothetical protein
MINYSRVTDFAMTPCTARNLGPPDGLARQNLVRAQGLGAATSKCYSYCHLYCHLSSTGGTP